MESKIYRNIKNDIRIIAYLQIFRAILDTLNITQFKLKIEFHMCLIKFERKLL